MYRFIFFIFFLLISLKSHSFEYNKVYHIQDFYTTGLEVIYDFEINKNNCIKVTKYIIISNYDETPKDIIKKWENLIERKWSNDHFIYKNNKIGLEIDINFVKNIENIPKPYKWSGTIRTKLNGKTNFYDWSIYNTNVVHEFGHMLGNYDEFDNGILNNKTRWISDGIMSNNDSDILYEHYFASILNTFRKKVLNKKVLPQLLYDHGLNNKSLDIPLEKIIKESIRKGGYFTFIKKGFKGKKIDCKKY